MQRRHHEGAERADPGRFHRCCRTGKEGCEHYEDQGDRGAHLAQQRKLLAKADALFFRDRRPEFRVHIAADRNIEDVKPREHQPRDHRADEQLAHRLLGHHRIDDGKDRGRDQDPERAPGHDRAHGDLGIVFSLQHGRQRDDAHGDDRRTDHAHHRRKDGGGDDRCRGQPAAQAPEELVDHIEHVLDDPGAFQHRRHEDEERDGRKLVISHQREDAAWHDVERVHVSQDEEKHHRKPAGDEGKRQAGHEQDEQRAEHDEGEPPDADFKPHFQPSSPGSARWRHPSSFRKCPAGSAGRRRSRW